MNQVSATAQWERLPSPSKKFYGASRSTLLRLIKTGRIRTSTVKVPGASRGLKYFASDDFIKLIEESAQ